MSPDDFITKWQAATLKERSAAQEHFIDLCRLLDEIMQNAIFALQLVGSGLLFLAAVLQSLS